MPTRNQTGSDTANRRLWFALISVITVVGLGVVGLQVRGGPDQAEAFRARQETSFSTTSVLREASESAVGIPELTSIQEIQVTPGRTPAGVLQETGVDPLVLRNALACLSESVPLRSVRPADVFRLYTREDGSLVKLEYQRSPEKILAAAWQEEASIWTPEERRLPTTYRLRRVSGVVGSSLYQAMLEAGGSQSALVEFAAMFAWDFDFYTDTRSGDAFELLVEDKFVEGERIGLGRVVAGSYLPVKSKEALRAFHFTAPNGESGYYDAAGNSIRRQFLKSPLNYTRISSSFSYSRMHPILKKRRPHLGIDYAAPQGTPVVSIGGGKVTHAGWIGGYGKTVKVKHAGGVVTQYAHLSRYGKGLKSGTRVKQDQVIGYVGSTGLSTGPHLDFRVRQNGKWINPLHLKGGRSAPLAKEYLAAFKGHAGQLTSLLTDLENGASVAWNRELQAPATAGLHTE